MNFIDILKLYQKTNSTGFRRKTWSNETYCYISDIDFCIIIADGVEDHHFCYGPDIQAEDWELK